MDMSVLCGELISRVIRGYVVIISWRVVVGLFIICFTMFRGQLQTSISTREFKACVGHC